VRTAVDNEEGGELSPEKDSLSIVQSAVGSNTSLHQNVVNAESQHCVW